MLTLSRRLGEVIVMELDGRKIEVMVISVERGQVRLGFTADKSVVIDRREIYERKRRESA